MILADPPTKNSKVFVTSVLNEHILFIRHADPKSNAEYQKILNEIAVYSVHAPTLNKAPVEGDFVLVSSDPNNPEEHEIFVAHTDYGNTNSVMMHDLR